mmetsp:Transcript_70438/g.111300  ORF Transcript_70438/g.111300 Transcript_70438/m.111300 type:complete len:203 (+) Transcript_70438:480-1088(+)
MAFAWRQRWMNPVNCCSQSERTIRPRGLMGTRTLKLRRRRFFGMSSRRGIPGSDRGTFCTRMPRASGISWTGSEIPSGGRARTFPPWRSRKCCPACLGSRKRTSMASRCQARQMDVRAWWPCGDRICNHVKNLMLCRAFARRSFRATRVPGFCVSCPIWTSPAPSNIKRCSLGTRLLILPRCRIPSTFCTPSPNATSPWTTT